MLIAQHPNELEFRPRAVAMGAFDGVHRGHRELIERIVSSGLRATVVTFDPHPRLVVGRGVELISSLERRLELLEDAGAQDVLVINFTPEVAATPATDWARSVLEPIGARRVVIGESFRFGHKRAGDAAMLRELGFEVDAVPLLAGTSSSRIREAVAAGDLELAGHLLGRPFELEGVVGQRGGVSRGDNLILSVDPAIVLPASGAYAGLTPAGPVRATVRGERITLAVPGDPLPLLGRPLCVVLTRHALPVRAALAPESLVAVSAVG
jgi:riboflavin kinase / FMN adenylyltransferase